MTTRPQQPELPGGFRKDIIGYSDKISLQPGQNIAFRLSALADGVAKMGIVELISGDDRPHGTGLEETLVSELGEYRDLSYQALVMGSYARVEQMPDLNAGRVSVWVWPTLLEDRRQTLVCARQLRLQLDAQGVYVTDGELELALSVSLQEQRWYKVSMTFGPATTLQVSSQPGGAHERVREWTATSDRGMTVQGGTWYLAASEAGVDHLNGRLEAPCIEDAAGVIAQWDFSIDIETQTIRDVSGHHRNGTLHQNPVRGVCGLQWDGSTQSFLEAPAHYGAIHFHDDDLTDAGWADTLTWTVPDDLPSGQYALKIDFTASDGEVSDEYLPFFVRGAQANSSIAYLAPTATYLAYANQRLGFAGGMFGEPVFHQANQAFLYKHAEVGDSLYEHHRDGSGVHFSSRLRPVMNLRPKTTTWAFCADTHITHWLKGTGQSFDVVTDEDLHLEGAAALAGYQVVITGTHPEYYSTQMRDGLADFLGQGGRLMYMGGNGFYWRVAFQPDNPAIMEVRRAEDGTRAWIARPGEYYHQFSGEYGGMWRRLGRPPNELVGIGFAAQGFDGGTYYRVQPGALDSRVQFIVDGVESEDDLWGTFGNQGGGAAGEEIDRFDLELGSPAHAVIIATSEAHKPGMLRVKEEFHMMEIPQQGSKVRADMVFFETPSGGAVFSTGSISYAGSLAHNGFDNNIARLTGNVLQRFIDPTPFEYP